MWTACLSFLFTALSASSLAAPSPLTTSANTVTTLSGLGSGNPHNGILIHVLRTEDLIADKIPTKPLLLERLSHLLIQLELGNQTVGVNGHHLPILPGSQRPLEINVQLKQVQMLKMPSDSPLVPLQLTAPQLSSIAEKYMSEGIVAAMLRVTQEPLVVEATRDDNTPIQAEAFKVTIAIKILEVDGLSLAQTELPSVDLLHLIVHPDPQDPTKVGTLTTLAPEALTDPSVASSAFASHPAESFTSALDMTRASLLSTFESLGNAIHSVAAHTKALLGGHRLRKPCHKRPQQQPKQVTKPKELAAVAAVEPKDVHQKSTGRTSVVDSFRRKMKCITKMVAQSSFAVLLLGLPLALVIMAFASAISTMIRRRKQSASVADSAPAYKVLAVDEKLSDEEAVLLITSADDPKY